MTLTSRVGDFWKFYGEELEEDAPGAVAACAAICKELKQMHGCVTVGCMKRLSHHKMQQIVCHHGNQVGWLDSIEGLLEHEFTGPRPGKAPLSAALISSTGIPDETKRHIPRIVPVLKLSAHLTRTGQMNKTSLPFHTYGEVITETANPHTDMLSSNDTRAIASEGFKYMATRWQYVAGDKLIFAHMGKTTAKHYPKPFGGLPWRKIYRNRFKHGRALSKKVSSAREPLSACFPLGCGHPPLSLACAGPLQKGHHLKQRHPCG